MVPGFVTKLCMSSFHIYMSTYITNVSNRRAREADTVCPAGAVLLILTFRNNGGNYTAINFVGIFSDKVLIILLKCHEDAYIFKWSKYLPHMYMVTKVAFVINTLNLDS